MSIIAFDVICPAITTFPFDINVSTATLEFSSCSKQASKPYQDVLQLQTHLLNNIFYNS